MRAPTRLSHLFDTFKLHRLRAPINPPKLCRDFISDDPVFLLFPAINKKMDIFVSDVVACEASLNWMMEIHPTQSETILCTALYILIQCYDWASLRCDSLGLTRMKLLLKKKREDPGTVGLFEGFHRLFVSIELLRKSFCESILHQQTCLW